jgi:flagellar basal body-associated protein FliL
MLRQEKLFQLVFLKKRKALSSLLIMIIVAAVVVVVIGAAVVYFWLLPGNLETEEVEFTGFTAVEVGWAFEVSITQSSSYSIIITADEKIFDNIEVNQTENKLKIGLEPDTYADGLFRKAEITMPELDELILSGATRGTAEGFSTSNTFVLDLSGASFLQMTTMNVGDAEIEVSGASTLNARGTAENLVSLVSGASNMDLSDFPVNNADVNLSGASQATINLEGRLDAEVSGASNLQYIGNPTMGDINTSDVSTIEKK